MISSSKIFMSVYKVNTIPHPKHGKNLLVLPNQNDFKMKFLSASFVHELYLIVHTQTHTHIQWLKQVVMHGKDHSY